MANQIDIIIDVPYSCQHNADFNWRHRACGVACLIMLLDFYGVKHSGIDDFISRGKEKGYIKGVGWRHDFLVEMAIEKSLKKSYRKEFKNKNLDLDNSLKKHIGFLEDDKPVIVSVGKKFKNKNKPHLIVLTGFKADDSGNLEGFYYHDPDFFNSTEDGKNQFVDIETFKKYWRKMSIFIFK